MHRLVGALALTLAGAAGAQTVVADDFESSVLPVPGGAWSAVVQEPAVTLAESPLAAHRGAMGLRVTDSTDAGAANGPESFVQFVLQPDFSGKVYFARGWFAVGVSNPGTGSVDVLQLTADAGNGQPVPIAAFRLSFTNNQLQSVGTDATGATTADNLGPLPAVDTWHLLETWTEGFGTDGGSRQTALDGVKFNAHNMDFTGLALDDLRVGEVANGGPDDWSGILNFDDVRTSLAAPASRLALSAGGTSVTAGTCVAANAGLTLSGGGAGPAPYAFAPNLTNTDTSGRFFDNAGCAAGGPPASFDAGDSAVGLWVRFGQAGAFQLGASYPDFLPASPLAFDVAPAPDAGTPDAGSEGDAGVMPDAGPPNGLVWRAGCGCGATPASSVAVLLILLAGWARAWRRR
jgi:hypothetical protein